MYPTVVLTGIVVLGNHLLGYVDHASSFNEDKFRRFAHQIICIATVEIELVRDGRHVEGGKKKEKVEHLKQKDAQRHRLVAELERIREYRNFHDNTIFFRDMGNAVRTLLHDVIDVSEKKGPVEAGLLLKVDNEFQDPEIEFFYGYQNKYAYMLISFLQAIGFQGNIEGTLDDLLEQYQGIPTKSVPLEIAFSMCKIYASMWMPKVDARRYLIQSAQYLARMDAFKKLKSPFPSVGPFASTGAAGAAGAASFTSAVSSTSASGAIAPLDPAASTAPADPVAAVAFVRPVASAASTGTVASGPPAGPVLSAPSAGTGASGPPADPVSPAPSAGPKVSADSDHSRGISQKSKHSELSESGSSKKKAKLSDSPERISTADIKTESSTSLAVLESILHEFKSIGNKMVTQEQVTKIEETIEQFREEMKENKQQQRDEMKELKKMLEGSGRFQDLTDHFNGDLIPFFSLDLMKVVNSSLIFE